MGKQYKEYNMENVFKHLNCEFLDGKRYKFTIFIICCAMIGSTYPWINVIWNLRITFIIIYLNFAYLYWNNLIFQFIYEPLNKWSDIRSNRWHSKQIILSYVIANWIRVGLLNQSHNTYIRIHYNNIRCCSARQLNGNANFNL